MIKVVISGKDTKVSPQSVWILSSSKLRGISFLIWEVLHRAAIKGSSTKAVLGAGTFQVMRCLKIMLIKITIHSTRWAATISRRLASRVAALHLSTSWQTLTNTWWRAAFSNLSFRLLTHQPTPLSRVVAAQDSTRRERRANSLKIRRVSSLKATRIHPRIIMQISMMTTHWTTFRNLKTIQSETKTNLRTNTFRSRITKIMRTR